VVGADGLRSTIRRQLLADGEPRYTGVTVWRGVTGAHMADLAPGESWTFLGPGFEFGFMPMIDRRVYWFASKEAPARERAWAAGHRAELLERHEGWPHPILDLIRVKHPLARWLLDSALARIPVGVRRQQEDRLLRSRK
jgi:FAD-dependent urate hydroxylase